MMHLGGEEWPISVQCHLTIVELDTAVWPDDRRRQRLVGRAEGPVAHQVVVQHPEVLFAFDVGQGLFQPLVRHVVGQLDQVVPVRLVFQAQLLQGLLEGHAHLEGAAGGDDAAADLVAAGVLAGADVDSEDIAWNA